MKTVKNKTIQEWAEAEALELLPCPTACPQTSDFRRHVVNCPWRLRPDVAAALLALKVEIQEAEQARDIAEERGNIASAERQHLEQQLFEANAKLASWRTATDYARGHGAENSEPGDLQAEIERLKGRNADNPVARLHNICDALSEDAKESPFSREEWHRMDAENVRLTKEAETAKVEGMRMAIQAIHGIGGRFAWEGYDLYATEAIEAEIAKLEEPIKCPVAKID